MIINKNTETISVHMGFYVWIFRHAERKHNSAIKKKNKQKTRIVVLIYSIHVFMCIPTTYTYPGYVCRICHSGYPCNSNVYMFDLCGQPLLDVGE